MHKIKHKLLKCSAHKGMFPDEYAIEFRTYSNQLISLFAEIDDVYEANTAQCTGFLKVTFYGLNDQGVAAIRLPSESLKLRSDFTTIHSNKLLPVS